MTAKPWRSIARKEGVRLVFASRAEAEALSVCSRCGRRIGRERYRLVTLTPEPGIENVERVEVTYACVRCGRVITTFRALGGETNA